VRGTQVAPPPRRLRAEVDVDRAIGIGLQPLGLAAHPFDKVLKIAGQPMSFQLAPKWYAEGPTGAPDWGIRFAVIFLFPKK